MFDPQITNISNEMMDGPFCICRESLRNINRIIAYDSAEYSGIDVRFGRNNKRNNILNKYLNFLGEDPMLISEDPMLITY